MPPKFEIQTSTHSQTTSRQPPQRHTRPRVSDVRIPSCYYTHKPQPATTTPTYTNRTSRRRNTFRVPQSPTSSLPLLQPSTMITTHTIHTVEYALGLQTTHTSHNTTLANLASQQQHPPAPHPDQYRPMVRQYAHTLCHTVVAHKSCRNAHATTQTVPTRPPKRFRHTTKQQPRHPPCS
jgi:hypothetical protein